MTLALLPRSQPAWAAEAAVEPPSYYLQYKAEPGGCTLELYLNTPAGHPAILSGSFGLSYPAAATLSFQSGGAVSLLWDNSASGDATLVDDSTRKYYVFSWARVTADEGLLHIGTLTVAAADALDIENFSLLDWAKTREAGDGAVGHAPDEEIWRAADVSAGETQGAYQGFYGGTNGLFVQTDIPFDAPTSGVIVSGKVSSYDPKKETKIELFLWNSNTGSYESSAANSSFIKALPQTSGKKEQVFQTINVRPGKYKIVISKKGNIPLTIIGAVVENEPVELSQKYSALEKISLIPGDIDGDGAVSSADRTLLMSKLTFFMSTDKAQYPLADLDGDGMITAVDRTLIMSKGVFMWTTQKCTVHLD